MSCRVFLQKSQPPLADVALRLVDDPPEGQVVPVGDNPEITQRVLDLHPVEEPDAAVDRIGNLLFYKLRLQGPGLIVGAVEHGDVPVGHAAAMELIDLGQNPVCLVPVALGIMAQHRLTGRTRGDQGFVDSKMIL